MMVRDYIEQMRKEQSKMSISELEQELEKIKKQKIKLEFARLSAMVKCYDYWEWKNGKV